MDHALGRVPVSIVVPAYNEARRLPASLPRLTAVARRIPGAELIVVDDGSTDGTAALAESLMRDVPGSRVVRLPWNSGKGTAIRVGVSFAHGEAIVFMDADLASDVGDLPMLLGELAHADVVLGSRRLGDSAVRTNGRRIGSWAFNQVTRTLTALDVADTQCGFKAFRHAEAKILFGMARSTGFGFDVEVLTIARSLGYRIIEVPVRWAEIPGGTFRVTRHTPAMLVDVLRSRRYHRRTGPVPGLARTDSLPAVPAPAVPAAAVPRPVQRVPAPTPAPAAPGDGFLATVGAGAQAPAVAGRPAAPAASPSPGHTEAV